MNNKKQELLKADKNFNNKNKQLKNIQLRKVLKNSLIDIFKNNVNNKNLCYTQYFFIFILIYRQIINIFLN